MDELLRDFLNEAGEQIEAVTAQLVRFERDPGDSRAIANIYRLVHSIKGTCGFLDLPRLEAVAHAAETLIGRLRDGAPPTPDAVSLVLKAVDRIKQIVSGVGEGGAEPPGDDSKLIAELISLASGVKLRQPEPDVWEGPEAGPGLGAPQIAGASQASAPERRTETVRVSVATLEKMMSLVSELVLARNLLIERARGRGEETLEHPLQRLSSVTTELQHGVMKARMQPIGRLFASLPRIVRDMAADLGKKIDVVTTGGDTELDRQLVAVVRDPLTHMIRNAVAHGVETPQARLAAGKPEIGLISVRAYQDAGSIVIEVADDGKGLDAAAIRAKAVARGLAREAEIACLTDAEAARFIFAPGFSTAAEVTALSGRGVGMDVVRENIEAVGGAVSVVSRAGQGAAFILKIPLTLAIAPALIVCAGGERFALPQDAIVEAHEIGQDGARLDWAQGAPVLTCPRGMLPARDLRDILRLGAEEREREAATHGVVLRVGATSFAVLVDEILEVVDIVVKPLPAKFARAGMFSGVTVMGDGAALLILDATGLARALGIAKSDGFQALEPPAPAAEPRRAPIVLFRAGGPRLRAVSAALVARIDRLGPQDARPAAGGAVARIGGRLTPLVEASALGDARGEAFASSASLAPRPVLVFGEGEAVLGLVVDEIVDVVDAPLDLQAVGAGEGGLGAASVDGDVVDVLDVASLMNAAALKSAQRLGPAVLVVDDSPFIREMLAGVLRAEGREPILAADPDAAAAALADPSGVGAILIDADLAGEDGFAFARLLLDALDERAPPIVGLAPSPTAETRRRAEAAGLRGVVGKFDRRGLAALLRDLADDPVGGAREAAA
jgi:two-component system chemotaxis sensor kinase CheA